MGRHKDLDTLSFINWLSRKGESLGFFVETEYTLHKNDYFVDLVWKLRQEQEPLITFEIETMDSPSVFSNTAKIFDTRSNLVAKPWRHFMVIYKTRLSSGHKESLFRVLHLNNVSLYEDVFNETTEKEKLEKELDNIAYDISQLIRKIISGKPTLSESLSKILEGLRLGLGDGIIKDPKISISVRSSEPIKGNIKFKMITETPKGEPTFFDKLREAQKTLKPFTVESSELKDLIIEGKSVIPKERENYNLTVMPTSPIIEVDIIVPETDATLERIMLRRTKTEGTLDYFSTEERNLPFIFGFILDREKQDGSYQISFEPSHADVIQFLKFENLIKALNEQKELRVLEPNEKKMVMGFQISESLEQDDVWYDLISKLAYIQERTKHTIPAPNKISRKDAENIHRLIRVINTGKEIGNITQISFEIGKDEAKKIVDVSEKEGKISGIVFSNTLTSYSIFNEDIPLGPSRVEFPDMKLKLPIDEVKTQIEMTSEGSKVKLTLEPLADNRVETLFEKWT